MKIGISNGNPDELVLVGRDPLQQGPGEVAPVEIGQRQILLAVVGLARIDGVAGEQRRPGLVQIVEIIRAGLVPHVRRRLLQHLLQRHDFEVHLDARIGRELLPATAGLRRRWAASARIRSGSSSPCICSPPPGAISSSPERRRCWPAPASRSLLQKAGCRQASWLQSSRGRHRPWPDGEETRACRCAAARKPGHCLQHRPCGHRRSCRYRYSLIPRSVAPFARASRVTRRKSNSSAPQAERQSA